MTIKEGILNDKQIRQLKRTSCNQAMAVIIWDTMIRNNGSVNRDLIRKEVQRRLVEPFDNYLMTAYTSNREAEVYTSMAHSNNYWIEANGWGLWTFTNGSRVEIENYFTRYPRNFGFESADELLDLLDLATEPYDPNPKPETKPEPEPEPEPEPSFKNTLVKMIENSEAHTERLKAILEEHYPEA